jgi:hypothetical protein
MIFSYALPVLDPQWAQKLCTVWSWSKGRTTKDWLRNTGRLVQGNF